MLFDLAEPLEGPKGRCRSEFELLPYQIRFSEVDDMYGVVPVVEADVPRVQFVVDEADSVHSLHSLVSLEQHQHSVVESNTFVHKLLKVYSLEECEQEAPF